MTQPVFRFAPSPNGALHLGHAFSALVVDRMARRFAGRFLVRIEDIDVTRARPEYIQGIFDDLAWLGINWERPVLYQSEHLADYKSAADRLGDLGLLYPCFASRAEIVAAADPSRLDPDGAVLYPGLWRGRTPQDIETARASGAPFAMRLDVEKAVALAGKKLAGTPLAFSELDDEGGERRIVCAPQRWGDVIILRKEFPASYVIAVVVDDARQGITHVTRGMDLFAATDMQRLLQVLLDLPEPLYHHHRLILDATGRKLSKSQRDTSLASLREGGASPAKIRSLVGL